MFRSFQEPGSDGNPVNLKSKGTTPVAFPIRTYQGVNFDATALVRSTVTLAGAPALAIGGDPADVDGDGHRDVVLHFNTEDVSLPADAIEACATGQLTGSIAGAL